MCDNLPVRIKGDVEPLMLPPRRRAPGATAGDYKQPEQLSEVPAPLINEDSVFVEPPGRLSQLIEDIIAGGPIRFEKLEGGIGFGDSPATRRGSFEIKDLLLRELCSTRTNCKIAYQPT